MIKVVYDHQTFGLQKYGGVSRYFFEISNRINTFNEFNAEILAPFFFNEYLRSQPHLVKGQYLTHFPKTAEIRRKFNNFVSRFIVKNSKPDIIHETYYQATSIAPVKSPIVITVYDMIHERFSDQFPKKDKTSELKRIAVNRADHIICISENTKKDLIEIFNTPSEKISVTYLGFSFGNNENISPSLPIQKPYILYVGVRNRYKNFERLLTAFASSSFLPRNFILVAFGGGKFSSQERQQIQKLGLNEDNIYHLSGSDEVLKNLYINATAFVYPSLYEGFGIPPLEAMSLNCPVICSNTSSIPEIVGNAGKYFNPLDIDDIKNAIERVIESESLKKDLISRGQNQLKKFSWDLCAKQTAKIYTNLV
jgi:glycosyltransferase involved in cell wall biosynthesis